MQATGRRPRRYHGRDGVKHQNTKKMKHFLNKLKVDFAALVLTVAFTGSARASNAAFDDASHPAYAGGSFVGLNGGYGFKPWYVYASPTGTSEAGSFIGSSTVNGSAGSAGIDSSGGKAFGFVAAVGTQVTALRPFENFSVLSRGQTVSVDFDNGLLSNGYCFIALYNGLSALRVSLRATAGDSTYKVVGATEVDTAVPITVNGIHVEFSLTSDPTELFGTISVAVTPAGGITRTVSVQLGGTEAGASSPGLIGVAIGMGGVGSGNAYKFFVNNMSVGYEPTFFSLTANTNGNGTVAKMPSQSTYLSNTLVTLTAPPAAGWTITGWTGAATGTANPLSVVLATNKSITANFNSTTATVPTRSSPIDGFNPDVDGAVLAMAVQNDGKIIVGGSFTSVGGRPHTNIARLNVDGKVDDRYSPSADSYVLSLAVQDDGKILAGGIFTMLSGQTRNYLGRLNADGTPDAFNPGANNTVSSLAIQADGLILVGGYFTELGGQARSYAG